MASNRKPATSPLTGREKTLREGKLPGQAAQMSEATMSRRERSAPEPQDTQPTVGKSGGLGGRAEKPSEGSDRRQASAPPVEVTRTAKPPAETPKARSTAARRTSGPNAAARTAR
jgi:hypothetical protein